MTILSLTRQIKQQALSLGFSAVGITASQIRQKDYEALQKYLMRQYHGRMVYLSEHVEARKNIELLFPAVKSLIMVLASYVPTVKTNHSRYKIAYYTYSKDYHIIVKSKLRELVSFIKSQSPEADGMVFCDTLPVFEKSYAAAAGLGWIGKNGLLINPTLGSYCVIGGIALNLDLITDKPLPLQCPENCKRCLEACPTKALIEPHVLNASRCVSYLTVENKEDKIPIENPTSYIAGCDICQNVCPYNNGAAHSQNVFFAPQSHVYWTDNEWETLTTSTFKKQLSGTSFSRIGLKTIRRNIKLI